MEKAMPNYKRIYIDIIEKMHPDKEKLCKSLLNKTNLSILDIISLNDIIFENKDKETLIFNQMHRSYDENAILDILEYQRKNKLNNTQLANHFKLSRNTVTKWKKHFMHHHIYSAKG